MTLLFPGGTRIILSTKSNCATATCIQGVHGLNLQRQQSQRLQRKLWICTRRFSTGKQSLGNFLMKKKISEEQFLERRQQEVKPLFDNLHECLLEKKNREILETSKTKQAINYCLNRWENLTRYLNYSYLTPSTNEAERTVRPFTLLRKNSSPGTLKLRRSSLEASGKMIKRKKHPVIGCFFFV